MNTKNQDAKLIKQIQKMSLMDDTFMSVFFDEQNDLMEFVLKIILNTNFKSSTNQNSNRNP